MAVDDFRSRLRRHRIGGGWATPALVFVLMFFAALALDRAAVTHAIFNFFAIQPAAIGLSSAATDTAPVTFAPPVDQHFSGCDAARAAGRVNIPIGDPSYREQMDGDGDGFACEPYYRR